MSKVKKSGANHYELLYIIPNKFTDDEAKAINEKIKKSITDLKGEITYSEDWGKKKLAYQIKGYNHGYYKLVEFDLDGVELIKIDNYLRLSKEVLRYQVVKTKKRTTEEIEKDKKKSEEFFRSRRSENVVEKPAEEEKVSTPAINVEVEAPKEEKGKKPAKKKADLKDLDKKLDDILGVDDLI